MAKILTNGKERLLGNKVFMSHPVYTGAFSCPMAKKGDYECFQNGRFETKKILIREDQIKLKSEARNGDWWVEVV